MSAADNALQPHHESAIQYITLRPREGTMASVMSII